jgi:hypothetical protein
MPRKLLVVTLSALLSSAGCYSFSHESSRTSPSTTAAQALGGVWATAQSLPGTGPGGTAQSCTNFSWRVTDFAGNSGSGTFTATCMGMLTITGTAQGLVSGTSLNWSAAGTATGSGAPAGCSVSLAGSSQLSDAQIRIPYTGTTCLGSVSGTEILGKS